VAGQPPAIAPPSPIGVVNAYATVTVQLPSGAASSEGGGPPRNAACLASTRKSSRPRPC